MDLTEDLSARVLLKHILTTEPPRTPITRSDSQGPSSSGLRRSSRLSWKKPEAQTPQDVLRRSLKHKIRESITRKSLSATTKRRTPSVVLEKRPSVSMLVSNEDTPRHLLRNILQTEPVKSPVVHEREHSEEPDQQSADRTAIKANSSIELSGLDLPDLTISNVASIAKGLSRKRPRQSLNVTAFEKRLKNENDAGEEPENSAFDLSSLSLSSSSCLSLKTPFADVRTEKRGLQRKVSGRRKITEREFEAAVSEQHIRDVSSFSLVEETICEVTETEGFTLGLSKLSMPDITVDIVNCNTALYDQPDAMTSNFSILATQDKPTVKSQLQTDLKEAEQEEEQCRMEQDKSVNVLPREEAAATEPQNEEPVSDPETKESTAEAEPQTEEGQNQLDDNAADASESEEEVDAVESETNADAQTEEDEAANSHSEENDNLDDLTEKEEVSPDSQRDEGEMVEKENCFAGSQTEESSQSEEKECKLGFQTEEVVTVALFQDEVEAGSEEEEVSPDSQTEEEGDADTQPEEEEESIDEIEDPAGNSQSEDCEESSQAEEEEDAMDSQTEEVKESALFQDEVEAGSEEEEVSPDSQTEEEDAADSQTDEVAAVSSSQDDADAASHSKEEAEDVAESQTEEEEEEEEEQLEGGLELISRKAHRSEGALILPIIEARNDLDDGVAAGLHDAKSKMHSTFDLNTSAELGSGEISQPQIRKLDMSELSVRDPEHVSCVENKSRTENENPFQPHGLMLDAEVSERESIASVDAQNSAEQEEEWDNEEAEVIQSKTPAFVKKKRNFFHSDSAASPSVLKNTQAILKSEALPAAKPKQVRRRKTGTARKQAVLPKTYLMSVFRHFAKTKVSADVYPVLNEIMDKFLDRLAEDLETYAAHAKRKTIEVEDAKLLLKRQGYVNDKVPVEVLIEKYLRMEQRKLLIPMATSGNVVIPKKGR